MIQTKKAETYVKGTEQKTGLIWVDVDLVSFLNRDGKTVVYLKIGEKLTTFVEAINQEITSYPLLDCRNISYSQAEIKTLIEATASDFNSPASNLLIDEINKYIDDIILNDITENPAKYYGLTADLWEKV